jgi:hypothetical protein
MAISLARLVFHANPPAPAQRHSESRRCARPVRAYRSLRDQTVGPPQTPKD